MHKSLRTIIARKMAAIFPNGGQTNNFTKNIPQTKFKDFYVSFTKSQTKSKSESDQQRYGELRILSLAIFHEKAAIFANGGQTNNFRRNIPQTKFKDLYVSFTKSQTKSKSESDQQRYGELCILSLAIFHQKGSHFSKWRPNE